MADWSKNNLDILRLFAAFQVAFIHLAEHLHIELGVLGEALEMFPGVPVFFFISGYLIPKSYIKAQQKPFALFEFYRNRVLRLYPGLFLCFLISILLVAFSGYLKQTIVSAGDFVVWAAAQLTFVQFYNPDFMREYGTGVLNGSLWTISVEIQFYLLTPLVVIFLRTRPVVQLLIMLVFIATNILGPDYASDYSTLAGKLLSVSFIPWFYMFLFGALLSHYGSLQAYLNKAPLWFLALSYLCCYWLSVHVLNLPKGNLINLPSYILLCALILKLAYVRPHTAEKLLKGNDLSYGIYIYHMPVINFLLFVWTEQSLENPRMFVAGLLGTFVLAALSWRCIERPSLRLKKITLRSTTP